MRALVADGARYRKSRTEEGQPDLLSWLKGQPLDSKGGNEAKGGGVEPQQTPPSEGAMKSTTSLCQREKWDLRREKNAYLPLTGVHALSSRGSENEQEMCDAQEDWWNSLVRDE